MSSEEEIEKSLSNDSESFRKSEKCSKITYSRDFLLSLSELDVCKTFPSGFDSSLLSEFEDGHHGTQDRLRNPGSLPLQNHRRTDYSSSPPTRGDSSNYLVYGRWDNRPSVRSGRDSDSQSNKDSVADSGRAFGNQFRKPGQSSEHDGLLGSGSFARPPGFAAGLSGPKGKSNDQYQLKKSNEPYQPPRPYKAGPLSRKEITDSLNDETFGSADYASEDQAEEERRRRESFELMRKEQQKSLQEKQNLTTNKLKRAHTSDFEVVGESAIGNRKLDESVTQSVSKNDSSKTSLQASVIRPLIPPGFKSVVAEKNSSTSIVHSREQEAGIPNVEERISLAKTIAQDGIFDNPEERLFVQKMGPREHDAIFHISEKRNERVPYLSTNMEIFDGKYSVDNKLYRASSLSEESETQGVCEIVKGDTEKVTAQDFIDTSKQAQHPSILDKLFGSVLSDNLFESSNLIEKQDAKEEDPWSQSNAIQSSKFAQWFNKDGIPTQEKKRTDDQAHGRPNDLLSIIGGGEKGGSQTSDLKLPQQIPSDFPFLGSVITDGYLTSDMIPSSVGLPKNLLKKSNKDETVPPILTCEDLEQTILSSYTGSSSTSQQLLQGHNVFGPEEPKAEADNHASHPLLSLLQKGPVINDKVVAPITENVLSGEKVETVTESGKPLTLETLFGSAFMKELQSAEAPVSALGSTTKIDINGASSINESNMQLSQSDNFRSLFGIYDTPVESDSSKHRTNMLSKHGGFDGRTDIQLPEEESLIGVGDPVNTHNSVFNPFGNLILGESQSSNRPIDISDKLAALATGFKNERPPMHGRHGSLDHEIPFHNLQPQSQMNHARPFLHQLETHPTHASSPVTFITQEGMIQRGGSMSHQLPANMVRPPFRYPSGGQAGFEPPHPILQQMQMQMQMQMQRPKPNNLPQHLQEYNRGASLPRHLRTRPTGPVQDSNPMQGFPFEHQEPNFGGPEMAMQVPGVSDNHPEAFQKLLEMELQANSSNHMHPFGSLGNNTQGLHGHDSDASFRYRL